MKGCYYFLGITLRAISLNDSAHKKPAKILINFKQSKNSPIILK